MDHFTRQLEQVRQAGRRLLIVQRLAQWLTGLLIIALGLVLVDYLLRLPSTVRLVLGLATIGLAALWLVTRLLRAIQFKPALTALALRAESLYPELKGVLASAVEFSLKRQRFAAPEQTGELAQASVQAAITKLDADRFDLKALIQTKPTVKAAGGLSGLMIVLVALIVIAPNASRTAAERWLLPFGDAQWPKAIEITSRIDDTVWPADTPVRLAAEVQRGDRDNLRVNAYYRVITTTLNTDGSVASTQKPSYERILLGRQAEQAEALGGADNTSNEPRYERVLNLPPSRSNNAADQTQTYTLEFYFTAGDDQTDVQRIDLIPRPEVAALNATVAPPPYMAGLVPQQTLALHEQTGRVATLTGFVDSILTLDLQFNKPLPSNFVQPALLWPELSPPPTLIQTTVATTGNAVAEHVTAARYQMTLQQTMQSPIALRDQFGMTNRSEQVYRLEANADKPPMVAVVEPLADQSVLATAIIQAAAEASDDVGMESLTLVIDYPERQADSTDEPVTTRNRLAQQSGRQTRLNLQHTLELAPLNLQPGDVVALMGIGLDVADQEITSTARRLRIIDEATLIGELRNELAGIRQQAQRLDRQQSDLRDAVETDPATLEQDNLQQAAGNRQSRLTDRLERARQLVQNLEQRLQQNRLDDVVMEEMLEMGEGLLNEAANASEQAEQAIREARQAEAVEQQREVEEALDELMDRLDQGRDAAAIAMKLRQLQALQDAIANDTRQLLPRTLGRNINDLPQQTRDALEDLARRQQDLARQADEAIRQMQTTAEALDRQGESDQDQATAQALAEAAAIARQQALTQQMQQSAQSAEQNQLSQAANQQAGAQQTLQQMLQEMGTIREKLDEMLKRRLRQLAEALRQLVARQETELTLLGGALNIGDDLGQGELVPNAQIDEAVENGLSMRELAPRQSQLRRATMAVQEQAEQNDAFEAIAGHLESAIGEQGRAVLALRESDGEIANTTETQALKHLRAALENAQQQTNEQEGEDKQERREELRQKYLAMAARQQAVLQKTLDITADLVDRLNRQHRQNLRALTGEQNVIRSDTRTLGQEVGDTFVFKAMHERMDVIFDRITNRMRVGADLPLMVDDQREVIRLLEQMAEALKEEQADEDFDRETQRQDQGDGGGGGGEPPEVIPPLAELKLIRALQTTLLRETNLVDKQANLNARERRRILADLAARQKALSDLGRQVLDKVQQQSQGGIPNNTTQPNDP